ncbi:WD40 repeat-like protein [Mytilinidion resinicola]|uniref:WD40 repeat-like protein n=1 Tax=Mytilinidion resinicola TaxID=574789 RepID=A0A6A6Z6J7_9PEZI|nr:WD40 repeat-like protein [Mytilinidion resinicola]KAF2815887.1 WD40 repeat-like protein [Mytilinidion resinicola]
MASPGLVDRLLRRELGDDRFSRYSSVESLYGDRKWIRDLDIVNRLRGHTGCVNALSWSRSGELLASGSDDTNVILHRYAPTGSLQFEEVGSISTGHTQNIFSVKFMPHSNDRTIITAARDSEVRIFDVEYSGRTRAAVSSSSQQPVGFGSWSMTAGDDDTNVKVFRSHSESVKRIVTEDSPFYFLTCSEDGDVRQWDIRLPSRAYPRASSSESAPQALISYKRQGIQLNTISCSPSQPQYIALGGDHLHCFLHDRRFLGRDILAERGTPGSASGVRGRLDEEVSKATKCVVRFAPGGRSRMRRSDNRQITACKISDAYPNELIVSWSGNSIYSFDIIRDAPLHDQHRSRESKQGKRKRQQVDSYDSYDSLEQATARLRTESTFSGSDEDLTLRIQNGSQREDVPMDADGDIDVVKNQRAHQIATELVNIRNEMFLLEDPSSTIDLASREHLFSSILQSCARIVPIVDASISSWQHPDAPTTSQFAQRDRQAAARRFLQATGLLARVLGGKLTIIGEPEEDDRNACTIQRYFTTIGPTATEQDSSLLHHERFAIPARAQFCYDFLKAICLWLDSGLGALLRGFSTTAGRGKRFPVGPNASMTAVETVLIPYLESLASDKSIKDVDASRFQVQESLVLFATEKDAVIAFSKAVMIPFADLVTDETGFSSQSGDNETQARHTALQFWAFKVGRGVLMNAARLEPEAPFLDYQFIKKAFGGTGSPSAQIIGAEREFLSRHEEVDDTTPSDDDYEDTDHDSSYEDYEEEGSEEGDASIYEQNRVRGLLHHDVPCHTQNRTYTGHLNIKTIKDVNFFGRNDEYVVSGSDCGHVFIWDKKSTRIVNILEADRDVANVPAGVIYISSKPEYLQAAGHPYEPMLAISGIDSTIKIFSADARDRQNARDGVAISHPAPTPTLRFGRAPPAPNVAPRSPDSDDEEEEIAENGLNSRRRLHEEYLITAKNAQEASSAAAHEPRITIVNIFNHAVGSFGRTSSEKAGRRGGGKLRNAVKLVTNGDYCNERLGHKVVQIAVVVVIML